MAFLGELWLSIALASVLVFVASSLLHMVLPLHRGDIDKLPDEDGVMDAIRGTPPGDYMFPCPGSMKAMQEPEMIAKFERGPVGTMTVLPGSWNMGKNLSMWFAYLVVVSVFVAYLTRVAVAPGAPYWTVFRVAGTLAVMVYSLGCIPNSIWRGLQWSTTAKFMFDGIVYGLVTAGCFAGFWPEA